MFLTAYCAECPHIIEYKFRKQVQPMSNEREVRTERRGAYTVTHISPRYENEDKQEAERQRIARQMVEGYIALYKCPKAIWLLKGCRFSGIPFYTFTERSI